MRIAEVSTLARPVPPEGEGSIEFIVHTLTEGLVARGHDVTLFALPGSKTAGKLSSPVAESYRTSKAIWDWQIYENFNVREAFRRAGEFDVIHCHSYHFGLMYCDLVKIPSLHSLHVEPGPDYRFLAGKTKNRGFVCCSRFQARDILPLPGVHIIPHGIDLSGFNVAPESEREDYLAFLGRFTVGKNPVGAIRLAEKAGVPIKLAAPQNDYYREAVKPHLKNSSAEYVGELNAKEKVDFLSRARALLVPMDTPEPFGLVLIEAMACGTPVVTTAMGGALEIVEHGKTGWLGKTDEELLEGIEKVRDMNREDIHAFARKHFSAETMIARYERLMQQAIEEGAQ